MREQLNFWVYKSARIICVGMKLQNFLKDQGNQDFTSNLLEIPEEKAHCECVQWYKTVKIIERSQTRTHMRDK